MELRFSSLAQKNNSIYIVPGAISALIRYDIEGGFSEIVTGFPDYGLFDMLKLGPIQVLGNEIIIAPINGRIIYIYNLLSETFEKVDVCEKDFPYANNRYTDRQMLFKDSLTLNDSVYFIGSAYPGIVKIDLKTRNVLVTTFDIIGLQQVNDSEQRFLASNIGIMDEKLYIPVVNTTYMVIYDTNNDSYKLVNLNIGNGFIAACQVNGNMILIPQLEGCIVKLKKDFSYEMLLNQYPEGFQGELGKRWFCCGISCKDSIWLFPFQSNMILKVNVITGSMTCIRQFKEVEKIKYLNAGFYNDNTLWGFNACDNRLDLIDCLTGTIEHLSIDLPQNMNEYCLKEKKEDLAGIRISEDYFELDTLIQYLCNDTVIERDNKTKSYNGVRIWNKLLEGE